MIVLAADTTSTAGPVGLFLILGLLVATVLLIRSMNGRLRKLPSSFEAPADPTHDQDSGDQPPTA